MAAQGRSSLRVATAIGSQLLGSATTLLSVCIVRDVLALYAINRLGMDAGNFSHRIMQPRYWGIVMAVAVFGPAQSPRASRIVTSRLLLVSGLVIAGLTVAPGWALPAMVAVISGASSVVFVVRCSDESCRGRSCAPTHAACH